MSKPPLSITEASKLSGEPKRIIQWAVKSGRLKAHKLDGKTGAYLINPADLAEFVNQRQIDAAARAKAAAEAARRVAAS